MNFIDNSLEGSMLKYDEGLRSHLNSVYSMMSAGILTTFAIGYIIANSSLISLLISDNGGLSGIGLIMAFSPFAFILIMGMGASKLPSYVLSIMFFGLAGCFGASMSLIFVTYTSFSIVQIFLITSIAFSGLSLFGYTTKKNLSAMGTFLTMGLIGIIGAAIVNLFMQSSAVQFAISVIGVLVFSGFTVYDTQRVKTKYLSGNQSPVALDAITFYLNFINLFLMLLRLFGQRR
jgi:FtsH-binding integral membrane protein